MKEDEERTTQKKKERKRGRGIVEEEERREKTGGRQARNDKLEEQKGRKSKAPISSLRSASSATNGDNCSALLFSDRWFTLAPHDFDVRRDFNARVTGENVYWRMQISKGPPFRCALPPFRRTCFLFIARRIASVEGGALANLPVTWFSFQQVFEVQTLAVNAAAQPLRCTLALPFVLPRDLSI
eukprot:2863882-Rhodomonas_salina.2